MDPSKSKIALLALRQALQAARAMMHPLDAKAASDGRVSTTPMNVSDFRRMRPTMWMHTEPYQEYATGRVIKYEVQGLAPGNEILIANFGGPNWNSWRVLQVKNGRSTKWTGNFSSAEAALTSAV